MLIATLLHVFPQSNHLGTEFSGAGGAPVALGSVAEEEESPLLLKEDGLLLVGSALIVVVVPRGFQLGGFGSGQVLLYFRNGRKLIVRHLLHLLDNNVGRLHVWDLLLHLLLKLLLAL